MLYKKWQKLKTMVTQWCLYGEDGVFLRIQLRLSAITD